MKDEAFDQLCHCIKCSKLKEIKEYLENGGDPNLTIRSR